MKYAQIIDGRVHGVFDYDPLPDFAPDIVMIPIDGGSLVDAGWLYDGAVFTAPEPVAVAADTKITRLAFRQRFTQAEKTTLELASLDNPAASMQDRAQSAAIRVYLADVAAATFIDLSRSDTRDGVQALEAAGILAVGRAVEILDAPIQPAEVPQ